MSFSYFDLANHKNGWPEDPLELQPFDYHFTKEGIIRLWIAVGFLPMTGRATEDPKVRHELGEGGAPPAAAKRLAALDKEYKIAAKTLTGMGYNGTMLGCELPKVKKKPVFCNEEAQIQHIVDNKLLNKAGGVVQDWSDRCKLQSCCGGGEENGRAQKEGKDGTEEEHRVE